MQLAAVLLDLEYTMLVTRRKTSRITLTLACLLGMTTSIVQCQALVNGNYSCNFEIKSECQWSQDPDDLKWLRKQGDIKGFEGPFADHTKGLGVLKSTSQGPGSLQFRGGNCIHIYGGGYTKPKDGKRLVKYRGCNGERWQFELRPEGILMHIKHNMCVKPKGPMIDGVEIGVYTNCNKSDTWSWTKNGSLQFKKEMCLTAKNGVRPVDGENLVLSSVCDQLQNFIKFVPIGLGWYLYMENSRSSKKKSNETARFISPNITKVKSCLQFYYHMFDQPAGSLQVYLLSEGSMGFPLKSFYSNGSRDWNRAQVAVNNQTNPYQYVIEGVRGVNDEGDIAIDDISVRDSCSGLLELVHGDWASWSNWGLCSASCGSGVKERSRTCTNPVPSNGGLDCFENSNDYSNCVMTVDCPANTSDKIPIFIAANTCVILLFVVINIVVLVKCRRRKEKPKLSTPDPGNISLTMVESLQEPSRVIEGQVIENIELYVIPVENETNTHENVLNFGYDELGDGTDDGSYQEPGAAVEVDVTYEDITMYQNGQNS